ncbi:hypothetical protein QP228_009315 [Pseudoglutamicibacter cumminsii]|nr:hypothetical protein [Pseudoglutamicibacter cumminsii]MDZ3746166.1 hypothetical protein [Pseudoglutamicibacter cumminsii]
MLLLYLDEIETLWTTLCFLAVLAKTAVENLRHVNIDAVGV